MANKRIYELTDATTLNASDKLPVDRSGGTARSILATDFAAAVRPYASNAEAEAGTATDKTMTPANAAAAWDAKYAATTVVNAKLANMAEGTIKGRAAGAGAGVPTDLTASEARTAIGLGTSAVLDTGRDIGDILKYEDLSSIPTIKLDSKIIFSKVTPTVADAWDVRVFRDGSGLSGGTPGFVNSALLVDAVTASGDASYTWALLAKLENNSSAGENVAIYGQATKNGQGPTWAMVLETREVTTATYGALVGMENAISCNGLDASNIRVVTDVIGARYDDTATIPEIYAGVRISSAWNGSGSGVESAKFKRPLVIESNWTDTGIFQRHLVGLGSTLNEVITFGDFYCPDTNTNRMRLYFNKSTAAAGWTNTDMRIDREVDGTLVGRISLNGDRSVSLYTGATSVTVKHNGGVVIPVRATDPGSGTQGELYYNSATEQIRIYTGSAWAIWTHV